MDVNLEQLGMWCEWRRRVQVAVVVGMLGSCSAVSVLAAPPHPRLIVNPERRSMWARMRADFEANPLKPPTLGGVWFKLIKTNAESGRRYGDNGLWGTLAYQMTGEARYADLAWSRVSRSFLVQSDNKLGGNYSREQFIQLVLMYDWLYPALSTDQRDQFLAKLNAMARGSVSNRWSPEFPLRSADSDQMVGVFFGLAALYVTTHEYNPTIDEIWKRSFVGGFEPDGRRSPTCRDVIHRYVTELAAGGEWIESEDYNLGTVKLLTLGAEMVRSGTGRDYFPEVTALLPDLALRWIHRLTPDLRQAYQWGDEQHPRDLRLFYRVETAMVLAGLTQSDPRVGPYLQDLVLSLVEKYGPSGYRTAEPWPRGFLVYNPYAPRSSRATLPKGSYADGMGMLQYRSGWGATDSLFSAHFPPALGVDHAPSYFGEFQLYRDGEWALTHPLSYGGPGLDGRGTNSMVIGGLPWGLFSFSEYRRPLVADWTDEWAYIVGTAGGQTSKKGASNSPPSFLNEWTRTIVFLPRLDTLVVHDRVNALDPRRLGGTCRREIQQRMSTLPALKQWMIHAPMPPRVGDGVAEWDLPSKEVVRTHTLLPADYRATVVDEKMAWAGRSPRDQEKRFHLRLTPGVDRQWDTFLNVVRVGERGGGPPQLVRSEDGTADGALLRGKEAILLLFNGSPAPDPPAGALTPERTRAFAEARFARKAWSASFEAESAATAVHAFHLDPALEWSATVDGRPVAISKRPSGVISLRVEGSGRHVLRLAPR